MYYGNVTFVMALPRSRTAWIAATFDDPPAHALHDPLKHCASIEDLALLVDNLSRGEYHNEPVIVVDTAAALFYPQINQRFPDARYCFIERGVLDVADSLRRAGQPVQTQVLAEAYDYLRRAQERARIAREFVATVHFDDLNDHATLRNLWRFFGIMHEPDPEHFKDMIATNIQIPFDVQQKQTDRNKVERLMATRHEGW